MDSYSKMDDIPYLKALVESMPKRLQDVIDRNGNTTKYYVAANCSIKRHFLTCFV